MLRHCVMFRWNEGVEPSVVDEIRARLDHLAEIDGVVSYRHGPDLGLRDDNFDYVVVGDFASRAAYDDYAADADHQALITDLIAPNISARAAVQFDIGA